MAKTIRHDVFGGKQVPVSLCERKFFNVSAAKQTAELTEQHYLQTMKNKNNPAMTPDSNST